MKLPSTIVTSWTNRPGDSKAARKTVVFIETSSPFAEWHSAQLCYRGSDSPQSSKAGYCGPTLSAVRPQTAEI